MTRMVSHLRRCIPVMSERLEAMPLSELPDVDWNASALFIERDSIDRLGEFLGEISPSAEAAMASRGVGLWPRLLHTTLAFDGQSCSRCAKASACNRHSV